MKWNDPAIDQAVKEGLKEFSRCKRNSKQWLALRDQLEFVIQQQRKESMNEKSN